MSVGFNELKGVPHKNTISLGVLVLRSQDRQTNSGKVRKCFQPVEKILSSIDLRSSLALTA